MPLIHTQETKENNHTRTIFLVRHAETAMNETEQVRGWTDVPLDSDTFGGLIELGESLKDDIDCIYASDLLRTLQTAHCISLGSEKPITGIYKFLHTWNPGDYTGKKASEIDPILERMAIKEPYKPTPNGESFEEFKFRFLLGIISILNENEPDEVPAFVCHGRNLAIMNAWKEADYNSELRVDNDHLGYDMFPPGTAHRFEIDCDLIH